MTDTTEAQARDAEPLRTADEVLATLQQAIAVGTVETPGEIIDWLNDRGYMLTTPEKDDTEGCAVQSPEAQRWEDFEARRVGLGYAVDLAKAGVLAVDQVVDTGTTYAEALAGNVVPERNVWAEAALLDQAEEALAAFRQSKRDGDPCGQNLLRAEAVAGALQAIVNQATA